MSSYRDIKNTKKESQATIDMTPKRERFSLFKHFQKMPPSNFEQVSNSLEITGLALCQD